ncbi:MAG: VIT1/CCC1 transporter family protein, partial [Thermosphaera sp.]
RIRRELAPPNEEGENSSLDGGGGNDYSPSRAARNAGVFYLVGAIGPIIPFLLNLSIILAIPASLLLSTIIITALTFVTSTLSGSSFKKSLVEYLLITYSAVAVTYLIGRLAGQVFGINV